MFCIKKTPVADEEPEYVAARSPQVNLWWNENQFDGLTFDSNGCMPNKTITN